MPKVYISTPLHWHNQCAIAGCDENTHNNAYADELEVYLHAAGIETKRGYIRPPCDSTTDGDELMIQNVRESDEWGADVHYISHTNAFNGTVRGYRPMIFPGSVGGKRLAEIMIKHRREIYDQPISLTERSDLYELRVPNAVSYYEEHVFHDNAEDAKWFHDNMRALAANAAQGLCEYCSCAFVDPYAVDEPAEEATLAAVKLPVLSYGSCGAAARAAMVLLKDQGYYTGYLPADDDVFGPMATAATKALQAAHGLDVDGVIGAQTWPVLAGV